MIRIQDPIKHNCQTSVQGKCREGIEKEGTEKLGMMIKIKQHGEMCIHERRKK